MSSGSSDIQLNIPHGLPIVTDLKEFSKIKAECMKWKGRGDCGYRDNNFPMDDSSLPKRHDESSCITWGRPDDITDDCKFIADGFDQDDVVQGALGDCWWVSAVSTLGLEKEFLKKVIPIEQNFAYKDYIGAFYFRFWRFGKWVTVVIDDRLPCYADGNLHPLYGHSRNPDEFWMPLLEKAYAKLHGSYLAIAGGHSSDALEDLTGGMAVDFYLKQQKCDHLYSLVETALKKGSFVCCSITHKFKDADKHGIDKTTGLVGRHAYSVTGVATASGGHGCATKLVRIRNPWCNKVEWKLKWSDYQNYDKNNGEWWMDIEDFEKYFDWMTICTMGPDFMKEGAATVDKWLLSQAEGVWQKNASVSQYYLHITEKDDTDDEKVKGKCHIMFGLMQEFTKKGHNEYHDYHLHKIEMCLYRVSDKPSAHTSFKNVSPAVTTGMHQYSREVIKTALIPPGHYVIQASRPADDVNDERKFLIRVYTEKEVDMKKLI